MANQAQAPTSANSARSTADAFTALLKDDIFLAIHNAFLLGWSIVELKSRIQIAACSPEQIKHTITSNVTPETQSIENLIKGIVLADLEAITQQEMLYYVQKSLAMPEKEQSSQLPQKALPSELRDQEWLTNVLRALFNRIVTLHMNRFPDSDTTCTFYTIQSIRSSLDYLNGGYATIGITPIKDDGIGRAFKAHFDLYDVTRRAINCLTLLLTTAEATLIKKTIDDNQKQLVDSVLGTTSYATDPDTKISPDDKAAVIKQLSNLIVQLLDAWDSFLRESYYVDPDAHNTELELTAYESARSLASLSWNASVILAPLENVFKFKQGTDIQVDQAGAVQQNPGATAQGSGSPGTSPGSPPANQTDLESTKQDTPPDKTALAKVEQAKIAKARNTWLNVFNDRDVNYAQNQITALSTALDEAYYRVNPSIKRTDPNDPTIPPNPDLPSQAIQAVAQSLNYWQRAITRICSQEENVKPLPNPQQGIPWTGTQATTPAGDAPGAGQTPKPVLDWDMSIDLRTELTQQSYTWQSLLLCQQGLQSFSIENVTQKILNEFMSDLEQAIKNELVHTASKWGIFAVVLLAIVGILIAGVNVLIQNPLTYIVAVGALLAPFVNGLRSRFSQFGNSVGSRFGAAGTAAEQGVEHGYNQVLIEFNYLNHNIGITYPLVEFFLWEKIEYVDPSNNSEAIKDGYDFLVHVFWTTEDREEELQRVVRAAYGPVGAFIGAQLDTPGTISRLWSGITGSGSKPKQPAQLRRTPESPIQKTPAQQKGQ